MQELIGSPEVEESASGVTPVRRPAETFVVRLEHDRAGLLALFACQSHGRDELRHLVILQPAIAVGNQEFVLRFQPLARQIGRRQRPGRHAVEPENARHGAKQSRRQYRGVDGLLVAPLRHDDQVVRRDGTDDAHGERLAVQGQHGLGRGVPGLAEAAPFSGGEQQSYHAPPTICRNSSGVR